MVEDQHYEKRSQAYNKCSQAMRQGNLKRPDKCFLCERSPGKAKDGRPKIHCHHPDYSDGLQVVWLCDRCHRRVHVGTYHIWRLEESNRFQPIHLVELLYQCFPRLDGRRVIKVVKILFPRYKPSLNTLSTWKSRIRQRGVYIPDLRKTKKGE